MSSNRSGLIRVRSLLSVALLFALGGGAWYALDHGKPALGNQPQASAESAPTVPGVSVDTISPKLGGLDRICLQPGTVEPFQAADLYAKVSGYLIEESVDIGSPVKAGDVLARIAIPEHEKQMKQDAAEVVRATAKVDQMTAAIATAEADVGAATSAIAMAQAEVQSKTSYQAFREKQRDRVRNLANRDALEAKIVEEYEDQYQAALSAAVSAKAAATAAKQKEAAAQARVKQAKSDRLYAEAEVLTAKAKLEKTQVLLDYAVIRSPYTGVVTRRNFHPGDFIKSAESGGAGLPLLTVERTDLMRVVVQVPESDVPFVDLGDPAVIQVDAIPGLVFQTAGAEKVQISRLAASEDPHTRMMRTEIHVKNPDGRLCRGMYGRVKLILRTGLPRSVRIPSGALVGKADGKQGSVRVVRDGKIRVLKISYGADNGSEVEVTAGLTPSDLVVVRANGPVEEGTAVADSPARLAAAH